MLNPFELQKTLVKASMPSGYESPCADAIEEIAKPFADEIFRTPTGSLVCHKKGSGKKLMFAAHMDVIGFMATVSDERGYISFTPIGGHSPAALIHTTVRFINGTRGIIKLRNQPSHMSAPANAITIKDLYIDIGAESKEEADSMVKTGDLAKFDTEPQLIGDRCMMSPYCDNLASCCTLLMAMEQVKHSDNDLYFVFTVQEEVGLKGAMTASAVIEPYMGIAMDLCFSADDMYADMALKAVTGHGPTVKIKDNSVICHPEAIKFMREAAESAGVAYQDEIITAGGTDTAAIAHSGKGAIAGCMSIPGRNMHSPCEIVSLNDMENGAKLIAACAEKTL